MMNRTHTRTTTITAEELRPGSVIITGGGGPAVVEGVHREGGRVHLTFSTHTGRMVKGQREVVRVEVAR